MPELPEVETVRRGLEPVLSGQLVTGLDLRRPDLRFPFPHDFAARVTGRRIQSVLRRAKYLLVGLEGGETLIIHLGMSGRLSVVAQSRGGSAGSVTFGAYVYDTGALPQHDHVVLHLHDGRAVVYNDPRRFGFMLLAETADLDRHSALAGLGAEPLSEELSASYLARKARGRSAGLKAFLLDQRVVAGLGNIYVCEALFRAGLSPRRMAGVLARGNGAPTERAERLVVEIKSVLRAAIAAGGSSLRDYRHTDGSTGQFQTTFAVYDREGERCCRTGCDGLVRRLVQGQRSTFYCSACQR